MNINLTLSELNYLQCIVKDEYKIQTKYPDNEEVLDELISIQTKIDSVLNEHSGYCKALRNIHALSLNKEFIDLVINSDDETVIKYVDDLDLKITFKSLLETIVLHGKDILSKEKIEEINKYI